MVRTRVQHLRENEQAIGGQLSTADEVQLICFYAERFRALTEQIEAEADIMPEIHEAEQVTDSRQTGSLDALQGFQADVDIIAQNLQMLEFDAPQITSQVQNAVGAEQKDFGGAGSQNFGKGYHNIN